MFYGVDNRSEPQDGGDERMVNSVAICPLVATYLAVRSTATPLPESRGKSK